MDSSLRILSKYRPLKPKNPPTIQQNLPMIPMNPPMKHKKAMNNNNNSLLNITFLLYNADNLGDSDNVAAPFESTWVVIATSAAGISLQFYYNIHFIIQRSRIIGYNYHYYGILFEYKDGKEEKKKKHKVVKDWYYQLYKYLLNVILIAEKQVKEMQSWEIDPDEIELKEELGRGTKFPRKYRLIPLS
jgi:hypothetical protein